MSITGATTAPPTYALNSTSLPALVNMTITGNVAIATSSSASAETFNYVSTNNITNTIPQIKYIPYLNTVDNTIKVNPNSTVGRLLLDSNSLTGIINGDSLLYNNGTSIVSTTSITKSVNTTFVANAATGNSPYGLCTYVIGADSYVTVCNGNFISGNTIQTYKWNGTAWISQGTTATGSGPRGVTFFTIGADSYLAVANGFADSMQWYKWNGTAWVSQGTLSTGGFPIRLVAYTFGGVQYLAVANYTGNNVSIYQWNGTTFVQLGSNISISPGSSPSDLTAFVISGVQYLAVSCGNGIVALLTWNGSAFTVSYPIILSAAYSITSFVYNSTQYLSFVDNVNGYLFTFSWNGTTFIQVGTYATTGSNPQAITSYVNNGAPYVFVLNYNDNNMGTYMFNGNDMLLMQTATAVGGSPITVATIDINNVTYVVNTNSTSNTFSNSRFYPGAYVITSPSLSVAAPSYVAKGGHTLQYSVTETGTPVVYNNATLGYTLSGNVVTAVGGSSATSGKYVKLKGSAFNVSDILSQIGATLTVAGGGSSTSSFMWNLV